jgi:hypothetical protein
MRVREAGIHRYHKRPLQLVAIILLKLSRRILARPLCRLLRQEHHTCYAQAIFLERNNPSLDLMLVSEGAIEVERGADQCEVGKRLREIPQRLPAVTCFLGVETEVVGIAEHALK